MGRPLNSFRTSPFSLCEASAVTNRLVCLVLVVSCVMGCSSGGRSPSAQSDDNARLLAGTWVLRSRVSGEGREEPAVERQMRLALTENGRFHAQYRGDSSQPWIRLGKGAFTYVPPWVTFYWESGRVAVLTVLEKGAETMKVMHGRNMAPMAGQEPDELYAKENPVDGQKPK